MTQHLAGWITGVGAVLLAGGSAQALGADATLHCTDLAQVMRGHWPDASTRVLTADLRADGTAVPRMSATGPAGSPVVLPAHCDVTAVTQERTGGDGRPYGIRFHVRLPNDWNGRLLFQGGGGSDGVLGDALGSARSPGLGQAPAAARGFAVVSQDSGHDNATDSDPTHGGAAAFGFDAQARADFGHASLKVVTDATKALMAVYYGKPPQWSYFEGCSKGGQEALAVAERYPTAFDGIVAGAPGLSLPRAAIAEAWDTQVYGSVNRTPGAPLTLNQLATSLTNADLKLVAEAVLAACDADDGLVDGMVGDFQKCTLGRVQPQLKARTCKAAQQEECLSPRQVEAVVRGFGGPRDSDGRSLYSDWPWDPGLTDGGWRVWKLGAPNGLPAINVMLGAGALATIFSTPPTVVSNAPPALLAYLDGFNFDQDAPKVYATSAQFPHSAWDDISSRSTDLSAFHAHGGKLLIYQGAADPVFSLKDTVSWYEQMQHQTRAGKTPFARLFAVPGMSHCSGGPATDQFDALGALTQWVEQGKTPERILASAGLASPWPGRARPLCAYPAVARYTGHGDPNQAESFECR